MDPTARALRGNGFAVSRDLDPKLRSHPMLLSRSVGSRVASPSPSRFKNWN